MKFQKSLAVLALVSMPAFAAITVSGSKSNNSEKVNGSCITAECCAKYPGTSGCNGNVLRRVHQVLTVKTKSTPAASASVAPIKSTKSNASDKEVAPTPGPTPKPAESSNINSSRSNVD
jgi:hypothetical protein